MKALDLYRRQAISVRWHTRIRAATAPLDAVAERCPREGAVLDVGCGHGLLANELALRHPRLRVFGIDVSRSKIASAAETVGTRPNVSFDLATLADADRGPFDCVVVCDVLYLVPMPRWDDFLTQCRARLRPGGRLLLKEVATVPAWKFHRLRAQEWLAVHVLGITEGETFHFEPTDVVARRLEVAGFRNLRITPLDRGYWTPHVLLEAEAP